MAPNREREEKGEKRLSKKELEKKQEREMKKATKKGTGDFWICKKGVCNKGLDMGKIYFSREEFEAHKIKFNH